jgi:hypothetical protein
MPFLKFSTALGSNGQRSFFTASSFFVMQQLVSFFFESACPSHLPWPSGFVVFAANAVTSHSKLRPWSAMSSTRHGKAHAFGCF